jgi:hypothetical protein
VKLLDPRWKQQPDRLEVWYATISDTTTGAGVWLHHELVVSDSDRPVVHGWIALFPPDGSPVEARFGPRPYTGGPVVENHSLAGEAAGAHWELRWHDGGRPLFTFPRWAWERELLPGAQVVPVPSASFEGMLEVHGHRLDLRHGRGGLAHIYAHGNAERWGWLHADLGGGDVLEIVAAVPRRRGLSWLPPVPMVQLRTNGRDWPRDPLASALLFRGRLGLPRWRVTGTVGRRRLRAEVEMPQDRSVTLGYADPDGSLATCANSETADAEILVERWARRWETERSWTLRGTAHAEIGTRP